LYPCMDCMLRCLDCSILTHSIHSCVLLRCWRKIKSFGRVNWHLRRIACRCRLRLDWIARISTISMDDFV
jgi:hypothetical protein